MKWIILIGALFGLCYGEVPVFGGAPYPASGWKPDGASFKLPTEYGPPQEQQPHASEIEITQERVDYAGMLGETTTVATPSNTYLPPDNGATTTELSEEQPEDVPEFISVQGLPKPQAAQYRVRSDSRLPQQQFRQQQQLRQQPQQQQFRQQPQQQFRGNLRQAPQQSQFRGNLRQAPPPPQQQQQQTFNQQPNEFAEFIPQNQAAPASGQFVPSGRLQAPQRQQQNFNYRPQQQFGRLELTPPATSYGVPQIQYGPPPQEALDATTTVQPNEETTDSGENESDVPRQGVSTEDYDESSDGGPVVAISNASDNASRGQYYILAPDNTLQKVVFMTSQTDEDRRNNGFSAQLKYSPVAPIRDPIYAYNEQGQLVRIYRKK